jgi:hypothetical protein
MVRTKTIKENMTIRIETIYMCVCFFFVGKLILELIVDYIKLDKED